MDEPLTDEEYHKLLCDWLGVCEPTDPAHEMSIADLEQHILDHNMDLPIVRRTNGR